jgi:hypothetical protein
MQIYYSHAMNGGRMIVLCFTDGRARAWKGEQCWLLWSKKPFQFQVEHLLILFLVEIWRDELWAGSQHHINYLRDF